MEEWLDIIARKLREERVSLPPGDWDILEDKYQRRKRSRWFYPLSISLVTAAAAAVALIVFNDTAEKQFYDYQDSPPYVVSEIPVQVKDLVINEGLIDESSTMVTNKKEKSQKSKPEPVMEDQKLTAEESVNEDIGDDVYTEAPIESNEQESQISIVEPERQLTRKKIAIASLLGGANSKNATDNNFPGQGSTSVGERANHSIPVTFGLNISFLLNERIALTSGIEASLYKSCFIYPNDKGDYDTIDQKAWYLGIPLTIDYTVWHEGRFSTWIGVGGKIDRCIYARRNGITVDDRTINWSLLTDAGISYGLSDHIGLFFAPELMWYHRPKTSNLSTYRTDNPYIFTANAGIRFSF